MCMNTYNDQVKRPPAILKANTCFIIIIITCVASAKAGLVVGRLRPFVLTNGPSLGTLNFRNFLALKISKNHLWNKPHLQLKGANKLKMRFIPLNFAGICWVLTLYWLPTRIHL